MKEVTDVLDCNAMWKEYEKAIHQVCEDLLGQVLNCFPIAVATLAPMYMSCSDQRLLAAVHAMREYRKARLVLSEGGGG